MLLIEANNDTIFFFKNLNAKINFYYNSEEFPIEKFRKITRREFDSITLAIEDNHVKGLLNFRKFYIKFESNSDYYLQRCDYLKVLELEKTSNFYEDLDNGLVYIFDEDYPILKLNQSEMLKSFIEIHNDILLDSLFKNIDFKSYNKGNNKSLTFNNILLALNNQMNKIKMAIGTSNNLKKLSDENIHLIDEIHKIHENKINDNTRMDVEFSPSDYDFENIFRNGDDEIFDKNFNLLENILNNYNYYSTFLVTKNELRSIMKSLGFQNITKISKEELQNVLLKYVEEFKIYKSHLHHKSNLD